MLVLVVSEDEDSSRPLETFLWFLHSLVLNHNEFDSRKQEKCSLENAFLFQLPHQQWEEETSHVPAKATCQSYCGGRCDRMDSFVNNVPQGSGLCFTHSPGDVFVMQKTCREKTTWLLVWEPAINHSHLLWRSGESGRIKSKGKMWYVLPADRRRLAVHACCRHKRITASVDTELNYDWWIDGSLVDFMHLTLYFLFFLCSKKALILFSFSRTGGATPPINYKILNDIFACPAKHKWDNSCSCFSKIYRTQWRDQGSNTFSMSKTGVISLHGAQTAVFRMMDYDQFDEDVCQHNTSSDGVSNWMGTCEQCNIMFWITSSWSATVYASSPYGAAEEAEEWKAAYQYFPFRGLTTYTKCSVGFLSLTTMEADVIYMSGGSYIAPIFLFTQPFLSASPQRIISDNH